MVAVDMVGGRPVSQPIVIGLCGSYRSGCSTVADFLVDRHGYQLVTLSDEVRRLAAEEYGLDPTSRECLQDAGNRVRAEEQPDYLATWVMSQVDAARPFVVLDAIRNVAEVVALRKAYAGFFLLGVDADYLVRRDRALKKDTLAQFEATDARDAGEDTVYGQQVRLCMGFADAILRNNDDITRLDAPGDTERLTSSIDRYHRLFSQAEAGEASPDELLMGIADDAAMASRCLQRQVGAVICTGENEGQEILAVGQNNPPGTERPCKVLFKMCYREYVRQHRKYTCSSCGTVLENLKCPECGVEFERRGLAGKELDYCRSLHAEEHAIVQLAKRPGSIPPGSELYTTTFPCFLCAKKIAAVGITRVVYADPYPMGEAYELLNRAHVTLEPFQGIKSKAFHRVFTRPPTLAAEVIDNLANRIGPSNEISVAEAPKGC